MKPYSVAFIGAGNIAWHLAPALDNLGFAVREVYSRKIKNARSLAERLYQAMAVSELDFSQSEAKLFFVCVPDDAINEVLREMTLPDGAMLVHTSGSQPLSILGTNLTSKTGVFYPLQTFTKGRRINFADLAIFIESSDSDTEKQLTGLAKALTKKVVKIAS